MQFPISVYAPNIAIRVDRKSSIVMQFLGKEEFCLNVIPAIEKKNAAGALWQTFYRVVELEKKKNSDFFIFCEDDHIFTTCYSKERLIVAIETADKLNAELLSGGMSAIKYPVQVAADLFWVANFTGMQFTVVYRRFYEKVLACTSNAEYVTDIHLSFLAKNKFVIYPYISVQKEFGYSDVTSQNNEIGRVDRLFKYSQNLLATLNKCRNFFLRMPENTKGDIMSTDLKNVCVPTYIINLKERSDRLHHSLAQFVNHQEFDVHVIEACKHEVGAVGLWMTLCSIIRRAQNNNNDYILICEDDHVFTKHYNREVFLRQILLAEVLGAHLLSGGVGGFGNLLPLQFGLYWCDWFWCTQFIVIYKKSFDKILQADFSVRDVADEKLSSILTNKMIVAPFISEQISFGYSDITEENNRSPKILQHFTKSNHLLEHYKYVETHILNQDSKISRKESNFCLRDKRFCALQLGCGFNLLDGWLNTDLRPTYGAAFLDVTQPFILQNNSVNYIFMEHLLEAFTIKQVKSILKECFRILKPNGVLRITIFSHENIVRLFRQRVHSKVEKDYIRWNLTHYGNEEIDENGQALSFFSVVLSNFMHKLNQGNLYDFYTLSTILKEIGYTKIHKCEIFCSQHKMMKNIERYISYMPIDMYKFEITILEASKK